MAILKHVAGKSADYGAALDYLKYEHDEVLKKPLLDANGNWVLRRDILLDGINKSQTHPRIILGAVCGLCEPLL